MEKIKVFTVIGEFVEAYGWGFLMLVICGILIAGLIEIIVKKSCKWLEKKWAGKEKLIVILQIAQIVATQAFACFFSIWFAKLVMKGMRLPGEQLMLPIWAALVYFLQFIFSYIGLNGIKEAIEARKAKKENQYMDATEIEPRLVLTKVKGIRGLYKDAEGNLCDKTGKLLDLDDEED